MESNSVPTLHILLEIKENTRKIRRKKMIPNTFEKNDKSQTIF